MTLTQRIAKQQGLRSDWQTHPTWCVVAEAHSREDCKRSQRPRWLDRAAKDLTGQLVS